MSFGLIQFGATPRDPAYAADLQRRAGLSITGEAARGFTVSAVRPVPPMVNAGEAREQLRQQVMAERGLDALSLYKATPQARIQAEAAVMAETARRARPEPIRTTGSLVDLRI
ncbi:MAG: hypothetical protein EPO51_24320 [Phenylobacterium sp.]|uniref:hypothetical protein n=1 Tax=Phenylobacterium sp. TaxID=1871053 RepID=UPI00120F9308|nr:hypothetical protein [Phenylobacterium sp.]TAJ69163.1 MAG: hypothetical protein EPO51_24320 [Phenylobacterium sp.]